MKTNYILTLLLTLCFSILSFGQNALVTGYVDSPCPSQKGRTLEIYVSGTVDFTGWSVVRQSNGGGFNPGSATIDISSLGTVTDSFVYLTNDSDVLNTEFNITKNVLVSSAIVDNGDDGFQIVNNSAVIIDRFGVDGEDASGKDWEHLDSYAYRKDGSIPNAGAFSSSNWTFGGTNLLDGKGTCNGQVALSTLVPFGSFMLTASTNPTITVSNAITGLDYYEGNGPSVEKYFSVEGTNLTADITVTAPTNFEVSTTSGGTFTASVTLTRSSGTVNSTKIYARLKSGLATNSYSGDVTLASAGATNKTVSLSGVVSPADPQFSFTAFLNDFNYIIRVGGPSAEQTFKVSGLFLTNDMVITAPINYEVSLTTATGFASAVSITPSSGTVSETTIYVRLKVGLTEGNYTGGITVSSTGVTDKMITVNGNVFGATTNSMIITGVYDGPLSGGTPKGVELYVFKNIADLSLFGVSSVSNGNGSTAGNVEFTFPTGSAIAGTFIYVATDDTNFKAFFGIAPTYTTGVVSINGDDSIELYESGQIIDVFGDVNKDGTGETWDYLDGWAYRNSNTGPEGTTFTSTNWTYSGINKLEKGTTNETVTSKFPIGTYTNNTASVKNNAIEGFTTYPNPITDKKFTVSSNSANKKLVTIFNVLGKKVFTLSFSGVKKDINVSAINSGVYILKVTENGKTSTKKLVIK